MNTDTLSKKVSELEKRIEVLEASMSMPAFGTSSVQQKVKRMSAKEFLLSKNLSTVIEKTLALAYYLERIEQMSSFNINDLADVFQSAREKSPANLNDMINKNIAKGYLMPVQEQKDAKRAWVLTVTGEKFIENNLNN